MLRRLLFFIAATAMLSSCEKNEQALVLPPPGVARHASVDMGENYDKQIFFDFETERQVLVSDPLSWDLAFEATPDGRHVFMNGGNNVFVYNTHDTSMQHVTAVPAGLTASGAGWQFDASCGLPDSTGIGEWSNGPGSSSKGEVYIVQAPQGTYQKMRILAVNTGGYTIAWAPLTATGTPTTVQLVKDTAYNYIYFSFEQGVVKPEPPKDAWDIVFTRYRPLIYDNATRQSVPYVVTGVLLNAYRTRASADSTTPFAQITLQMALAAPATNYRDIIGYDWKEYSFISARYTVNRAKNYLLHTRRNQRYKLHFLDFYNSSGVKGSPLFEYERLQ